MWLTSDVVQIRFKNAARGGVHRADFLDQMIVRLQDPDQVACFNHVCSGYTPRDDAIVLHFTNQPDQEADVVIASDRVRLHGERSGEYCTCFFHWRMIGSSNHGAGTRQQDTRPALCREILRARPVICYMQRLLEKKSLAP